MSGKSFWLNISGSVLVLIWTIYYYAKRYTGGIADTTDTIVCGIVNFVCVAFIIKKAIGFFKKNRESENEQK